MTSQSQLNSDDMYVRLGLPVDCDEEAVRHAYRTLVRQYSPERNPEEFKRIREAYEVLGSAEHRVEYDRSRPSRIDSMCAEAEDQFGAGSYDTAEHLFKRVLVEHPGLHKARNFLGLCFLYQNKAGEALQQYDRLLREPSPFPVWFSNRAHALMRLSRFPEAENDFKEGVARACDIADVCVRTCELADFYIGRSQYDQARSCIEARIPAKPAPTFEHASLLLKLLRIELLSGKEDTVRKAVRRAVVVAQSNDEKQFVAFRFGSLAVELIRADAYSRAAQMALQAKQLQSEDIDYEALHATADAIEHHRHQEALRLVRSHVSYAEGGWLASIGPVIKQYCQSHKAFDGMEHLSSPPTMRTINTLGTMLYGRSELDAQTESYVATLYFGVLFLPIFPLSCYRVRDAKPSGWHFLGQVPFRRQQKAHLAISLAVIAVLLLFGVASPNPSQPSTASVETPLAASVSSKVGSSTLQLTPAPSADESVWEGTVVNDAYPALRSHMRLALESSADTTAAKLMIDPPLSGSGDALAIVAKNGDVAVISMSVRDTIVWRATRTGDVLAGRYAIVGGPSIHQMGWWRVHRATATP